MQDTDRRTFLQATGLAGGLALVGTAAGQDETTTPEGEDQTTTAEGEDQTTTPEDDDNGLVTVESDDDFEATVERIETDIEENQNLTLVTMVDHAENAESAGMELQPTTLFVFGNPQLGTQLMQERRSMGIDLPQKMLVWEAEDGTVNVTYNDPEWLAGRHGIEAPGMIVEQVSRVLQSLATSE